MKRKPLIETNPYLRDPEERERLISRSVDSSCRVEGIEPDDTIILPELKRRPKRLDKRRIHHN